MSSLPGAPIRPAFAQKSERTSPHVGVEEKNEDRPDLRDRWMMRGRSAPAGQSAAALRLRAQQQKMTMRAAVAATKADTRGPGLGQERDAGSGTPWVPLGPAPLASDQNAYGPVAGRATALAIDPTDAAGNTVYVAAASGGVWKSTNGANATAANVTWTALTDQQASLVNGAVSVKPDGSVVLVGTGEPDSAIDSYYGLGILRSTDYGAHWTSIPTALGNNPALSFAGLGFSKFAWDTSPATTVVAATGTTTLGFDEGAITDTTNRGLYYSNDSGQTWTFEVPLDAGVAVSPASISATDVVYNAMAGKFFAAIRYHGVYSSSNGQNWTRLVNQPNATQLSTANCPAQIPNSGSSCPIYRGQLAVVPGRKEMYFWFVSLTTGPDGVDVVDEGIWRSLDGGNSWNPIDETGIASCGDPGDNGCGVDQGYYNLEIAALPDGAATDLYAGAVNLFKCALTTGGTTCSTLDPNYPNQWINLTHVYGCSSIAGVHPGEHGADFMITGGKALMYFANDGGVYRTLDGYSKLDSGTCGTTNGFDNLNASSVANETIGSLTQFVSFSLHPTDQNTLLGGMQRNGSAATSTATTSSQWSTVNGGDGGYTAINPAATPQWFTANPYVNIYVCDNGINCTTEGFNLTVGSEEVGGDTGPFYTPYILDPQNSSEMLVGTCRVWRGAPTVPASSFTAISVDFDTLAPATCTGEEVNLVRGLAEGGPTASGLSTTVYATTEGTGPNATAPTGGEVWATTNAGVAEMTQVTGAINPSNYTISSVAMDTSDATGATAYVGIMGFNVSHVFKTTNAGASWTDWSGSGSTALPAAPVNALLVDSSVTPTQIYAGTDVGVFTSSTDSANWTEVGTTSEPGGATGYLPNVPVTAMRIFDWAGVKKLRVSTYGRGIWEYALPTGPDYTNVISNSQTIFPSQTATFNGTLTAYNGYTSVVNLSCAAPILPATCTLNPTQTTPLPSGAPYTVTAGGVVGDYNFNAHAVGTDPDAITHDAPVALHVVDFNLSTPNPDALTVEQGNTANATFQVSAEGSFSGTVNLSCSSGLPAGTGCQCSPSSVTPTAANPPPTVTMTVAAAANAPVGGPTTVTLWANTAGAPAPKPQFFYLTVIVPPPDFALAVAATPSSTVVGQNATWNGTLTALSGYSGTVSLSCVGAIPGTCLVNPAQLAPTPSGAAFTVTAGNATTGTFNFSIQGTDATLTHSQPVSLTVGTDVTWTDTGSSSATVAAGQSATYTFSATPVGGATFSGSVNFACANLPALTNCSFSPASIPAGAPTTTVTLTLATTGPNQGTESRKAVPSTRYPVPSEKPGPPKSGTIGLGAGLVWLLTIPIAGVTLAGLARRRTSRKSVIAACVLTLAWLALLVACGALGGGAGGNAVTVAVSPQSAQVSLTAPNNQQPFSATVVNGSSQAVTWAVVDSPETGTIDPNSGLYTAPKQMPSPQQAVTVTATSPLTSSPGTATVTLTGPQVTVTVSPAEATVPLGGQQQFTATVSNTSSVTWTVNGAPANGTIDTNGLYTAPATVPNPATATVTATSQADPLASSTATVLFGTASGTYSNIQVTATAAGGPAHTDLATLTVD
jgi:hypothetical protein